MHVFATHTRRYRPMSRHRLDPKEEEQDAVLTEDMVNALHDLLARDMPPAGPNGPAELRTTEQIWGLVDSHSPGLIPIKHMREAMLRLNYIEQLTGSGFYWRIATRA